MADQDTNLDTLAASSASKETLANALFDVASPAMLGGRRASTTTGLTWGYYGGMVNVSSGSPSGWQRIPNNTLLLTGNATNYIELDPTTGVVSKNTSAFTAGRCPLYKAVTNASTVIDYEDWRRIALATY
jgi:hypothetical protein